ncbi:hypothetical protein [Streptomyces sp. NPDC050145]|uniref:phage terminase small subunit n=1 Tax=Streptomyces sp. NPDC050145 TaxID=3365602 RepID=UPI0037BC641A
MAGMGPAPKDPSRRARRNKDPIPQTTIRWERAEAPELPEFRIERDGELVEFVWPERTREWWQTWVDSPLSDHFMAVDWEFHLGTALVHARHWQGDRYAAAELRLREAQLGATLESRARLRIVTAEADNADEGRGASGAPSAKERYGQLRSLPGGQAGAGKST